MASYKQVVKKLSSELKHITHIPVKEVEILLLHILNQNVIWLHINYNKECDNNTLKQLEKLVKKRATDYPIEYITSRASFYGETFNVAPNVLIPRPQTEILVEKAIETLNKLPNPKVVEIGTGSGIISVMLALEVPNISIIAVDINDDAIALAKSNAKKFDVEHKITFVKSDIFNSIDVKGFDMCISNPPYIKNNYKLPKNVTYEPSNALFGGDDGDELLKKIIDNTYTNNIKYLYCEMGYDQKEPLSEFLKNYKTKSIEFYKDYEKFDRGFTVEFDYE
jgi:release factor glutamine methyltransferase